MRRRICPVNGRLRRIAAVQRSRRPFLHLSTLPAFIGPAHPNGLFSPTTRVGLKVGLNPQISVTRQVTEKDCTEDTGAIARHTVCFLPLRMDPKVQPANVHAWTTMPLSLVGYELPSQNTAARCRISVSTIYSAKLWPQRVVASRFLWNGWRRSWQGA